MLYILRKSSIQDLFFHAGPLFTGLASFPREWSVWFFHSRRTRLIPHTSSGSAPPASLNRALQTASDLTARCPMPWEGGLRLGSLKSGNCRIWADRACSAGNPQKLGTSLSPWCVVRTGSGRGEKESLSSLLEECGQLLESESAEQIRGPLVVKG